MPLQLNLIKFLGFKSNYLDLRSVVANLALSRFLGSTFGQDLVMGVTKTF